MTAKRNAYHVKCDSVAKTIYATSAQRAAVKFAKEYFHKPCVAVPASFLGEDYFELEVPIGIGTLFAKCVVTPATEQGRLL